MSSTGVTGVTWQTSQSTDGAHMRAKMYLDSCILRILPVDKKNIRSRRTMFLNSEPPPFYFVPKIDSNRYSMKLYSDKSIS